MLWRSPRWLAGAVALTLLSLASGCGGPERRIEAGLREGVLFFSNFEKGVDALYSAGSPLARIDGARTHHLPGGGKVDGCVAFDQDAGALVYSAKGNFPYRRTGAWSGSVSFWMSAALSDLRADFPEPFHIGKIVDGTFPWDDAAIFVDFSKPPRALRFGCYPDKVQEVTDEMVDRQVLRLKDPGWSASEWRHVVVAWANFNSGRADAEWALFVDGVETGRIRGLRQDVAWDMEDQVVRFNHYRYAGRLDEIAIFDRMLTPEEAKYLYSPGRELKVLLKKER